MTLSRQGETGFVALGVTASTLAFLVALLGFGAAWWSRGRAGVVDDLLEGRNLLAYWDYKIDENGDLKPGYVYIGQSGVYKDGVYFQFEGKGRRLAKSTFTPGPPAILSFTCIQRSGNNASYTRKSYPQIVIPVPAGKESLAERIARQLNPE